MGTGWCGSAPSPFLSQACAGDKKQTKSEVIAPKIIKTHLTYFFQGKENAINNVAVDTESNPVLVGGKSMATRNNQRNGTLNAMQRVWARRVLKEHARDNSTSKNIEYKEAQEILAKDL